MKRLRSKLITTVTPIRNGAIFVNGLVNTISCQTTLPFEAILSDNSSDDETWNAISHFSGVDGWKVIRQTKRLDAHHSWLAAIKNVNTEYLMFLPCDDRIHPSNIMLADEYLKENTDIDVLGSLHINANSLAELDSHQWQELSHAQFVRLSHNQALELMLNKNLLAWPFTGQIIRTSFITSLLESPDFPILEGMGDIAISITAVNNKKQIAVRNSNLVLALRHEGQESCRLSKKWLSDYLCFSEYVLSLSGISPQYHLKIFAYTMKQCALHYYVALGDKSQLPSQIASKFRADYWPLLDDGLRKFGPELKILLRPAKAITRLGKRVLLMPGGWVLILIINRLNIGR